VNAFYPLPKASLTSRFTYKGTLKIGIVPTVPILRCAASDSFGSDDNTENDSHNNRDGGGGEEKIIRFFADAMEEVLINGLTDNSVLEGGADSASATTSNSPPPYTSALINNNYGNPIGSRFTNQQFGNERKRRHRRTNVGAALAKDKQPSSPVAGSSTTAVWASAGGSTVSPPRRTAPTTPKKINIKSSTNNHRDPVVPSNGIPRQQSVGSKDKTTTTKKKTKTKNDRKLPLPFMNKESVGLGGNWEERHGNFILRPSGTTTAAAATAGTQTPPLGIVHFLGGAFVGAAPHLTYRYFLEAFAAQGYVVVATPYRLDLDYLSTCEAVLARFDAVAAELNAEYGFPRSTATTTTPSPSALKQQQQQSPQQRIGRRRTVVGVGRNSNAKQQAAAAAAVVAPSYLPVIGLGHSCGALLQSLISSLFPLSPQIARTTNVLISYNNRPASQAVPAFHDLLVPLSAQLLREPNSNNNNNNNDKQQPQEAATPTVPTATAAANPGNVREVVGFLRRYMDLALTVYSESPLSPKFVSNEVVPLFRQGLEVVDQVPPLLREVVNSNAGNGNGAAAAMAPEFTPSAADAKEACRRNYRAPYTLLLQFEGDESDQSEEMAAVLREADTIMRMRRNRPLDRMQVDVRTIRGEQITALTQNLLVDLSPFSWVLSPSPATDRYNLLRNQVNKKFHNTVFHTQLEISAYMNASIAAAAASKSPYNAASYPSSSSSSSRGGGNPAVGTSGVSLSSISTAVGNPAALLTASSLSTTTTSSSASSTASSSLPPLSSVATAAAGKQQQQQQQQPSIPSADARSPTQMPRKISPSSPSPPPQGKEAKQKQTTTSSSSVSSLFAKAREGVSSWQSQVAGVARSGSGSRSRGAGAGGDSADKPSGNPVAAAAIARMRAEQEQKKKLEEELTRRQQQQQQQQQQQMRRDAGALPRGPPSPPPPMPPRRPIGAAPKATAPAVSPAVPAAVPVVSSSTAPRDAAPTRASNAIPPPLSSVAKPADRKPVVVDGGGGAGSGSGSSMPQPSPPSHPATTTTTTAAADVVDAEAARAPPTAAAALSEQLEDSFFSSETGSDAGDAKGKMRNEKKKKKKKQQQQQQQQKNKKQDAAALLPSLPAAVPLDAASAITSTSTVGKNFTFNLNGMKPSMARGGKRSLIGKLSRDANTNMFSARRQRATAALAATAAGNKGGAGPKKATMQPLSDAFTEMQAKASRVGRASAAKIGELSAAAADSTAGKAQWPPIVNNEAVSNGGGFNYVSPNSPLGKIKYFLVVSANRMEECIQSVLRAMRLVLLRIVVAGEMALSETARASRRLQRGAQRMVGRARATIFPKKSVMSTLVPPLSSSPSSSSSSSFSSSSSSSLQLLSSSGSASVTCV